MYQRDPVIQSVRYKPWLLASVSLFLLVNTGYFWELLLGAAAFPAFIVMFVAFFILTGAAIFQSILSCLEKFRNRNRLMAATAMLLISACVAIRPNGIFNFETLLSGKAILYAEREGAANCLTGLRLHANGTFRERTTCFGVTETSGRYKISGDTVFFSNVSLARHEEKYYQFAVIRRTHPYEHTDGRHYIGSLIRYRSYSDTGGEELWLATDQVGQSPM